MAWLYWHFTGNLVSAVVAAVVMLVLGFLLSAVGGYLVGLVGGSNQPVSGLTLSALILVGAADGGLRGDRARGRGRGAGRGGGGLLRDLRLGQPDPGSEGGAHAGRHAAQDGDRPRSSPPSPPSFVLVFPMLWLHDANIKQGGIGIGDRELSAPQAGLMAQLAQGIVGGEMPWGLILFGMCFSVALILMKAPSPTLIAVGMYLPFETTGAIFVGGCLKALADRWPQRRGIAGRELRQLRRRWWPRA